jgi:hypothetical protein
VSGLVLWVLGTYVFKGTVPDAVTTVVYILVPAATAFAAGYLAKHTDRTIATATVTVAAPPEKTLLSRGGYSAGDTAVSDLPPPPPSVTAPAAEVPPAAPE